MATRPYNLQVKYVRPIPHGNPRGGESWIEIDGHGATAQTPFGERLLIVTIVSGKIQNHPEGLLLEALEHVRSLLDAQILAMQSP